MREADESMLAWRLCENAIRPGVTTADLDAAAAEVIRKHGGKRHFQRLSRCLIRTRRPSAPASTKSWCMVSREQRKLKEGDIVSVDCGTILEGFVGDSAFTAGVGEISEQAQSLLKVTEKSLYIGIEKMRCGQPNRRYLGMQSRSLLKARLSSSPESIPGMALVEQMHEGPQVPNYGPGRGCAAAAG